MTHVALAIGPDDVMEFDEGGASARQIIFGSGYGLARGKMAEPSRKGKRYDVYKCTDSGLAASVVEKADLICDLVEQSSATAIYGLKKMLKRALGGVKGQDWTQGRFDAQLNEWIGRTLYPGRHRW